MQTNAGRKCTVALGVVGLALLSGACERNDPTLEHRADQIEHQGDQAARRLRAQADEVAHSASRRADEVRDQARNTDWGVPRVQPVAPGARGGGPIALDTARDQYAAARCDREERCNNVGPGRRHDTRAACLSSARADRTGSWDSADCRMGVNSNHLSDCLAAVRGQDCNNPIDDLSRLAACRSGEVCGR